MTARIRIGSDYYERHKHRRDVAVEWNERSLANPHVGVTGTTGAGKTHWIKRFVSAMPASAAVDIYDYHGDIDVSDVADSVEVLFSESTRFGYNPLVVNPDPHFGGVRRCITTLIEAINSSRSKLGEIQTGVLRNLILDTFALRRIYPDQPATWRKQALTEAEAKALKDQGDYDALRNAYPHLADVVVLARRKLKALWLGVDDDDEAGEGRAALTAFDECTRAMVSLNTARKRLHQGLDSPNADVEALQRRFDRSRDKAKDAFNGYLDNIETGREFDDAVKYNSKDTLTSVITRLENMIATGMFNPNPPPFHGARVRRFNLKPVAQSGDELRMFVNFRLEATIREEMQRGESNHVRRVIVLDECKTYLDEDPRAPINVIATEMRKFGVMLLMAGQSPVHWSQDFIRSAGTLLLLNLAPTDWTGAVRKLGVEKKDLEYLRPQETGAVRLLEKGRTPVFRRIVFDQTAR